MSGALDPAKLVWPTEEDAASDSLEANHDYMPDIRAVGWDDVARIIELEAAILPRLDVASDPSAEWDIYCQQLSAEAREIADELFTALDPGVASATLSLGAAGCIPFWSCNGGAYGGAHSASDPVVKFFAKPQHADLLLKSAERANVDLIQDVHGRCAVVARNVPALRLFAKEVSER